MCEIFGTSLKYKTEINRYLKEFFSHSNHHPHGWGLAFMDHTDTMIEKEPLQASKSHYLKSRLTVPIVVRTALAHIRYATVGNVEYCNCHPYSMKDNSNRRWTMVHNGTIFEFDPLSKFYQFQTGNTDSERILYYIIEQINKKEESGTKLTFRERFELLDSIFIELSKGNKVNVLLYDGEYLYVHTNYKESLFYLEKEEGILFSTKPLSQESWKPVAFTTLLAFQDGKQILSGTNHKNEFIESEENLRYLYQIFSNL
ncbi:class II glutamine amidotransferase [Anaerostipes faecalis]|uniref:class II glutamine amidotransferase n=1 Tax=Anaerostipes faecalis TaxID=2738446 RepID=UPI003F052AD5